MSSNYEKALRDSCNEPTCDRCGADMDWVDCETCGGEGLDGHDCGEDCCMCADPDEPNLACGICDGEGGWELCPNRCANKPSTPGTTP